jgi:hypothetical protein
MLGVEVHFRGNGHAFPGEDMIENMIRDLVQIEKVGRAIVPRKSRVFALGVWLLAAAIHLFGGSAVVWSAVENLDEMVARKARHAAAVWGPEYVEGSAAQHYVWQPETLCYRDVLSGREVWRLTHTPSRENWIRDINMAQWSADGKRLVFASDRETKAYPNEGYVLNWMHMKADGSFLRMLPNAPSRAQNSHEEHFYWSPQVPDLYYAFGRSIVAENLSHKDLYKVEVSDTSEKRTLLLTFPSASSEWLIKSRISPDGKYLVGIPFFSNYVCPANVAQDGDLDVYGNEIADNDNARFLVSGANKFYPAERPFDYYWGEPPGENLGNYSRYSWCRNGTTNVYYALKRLEGQHKGSNGSSLLVDTTRSWPVNALVGSRLENATDGSSYGTVTANTATTVTCTLTGGKTNRWNAGDSYILYPNCSHPELFNPALPLTGDIWYNRRVLTREANFGALGDGEYYYGDQNRLGFSTVYLYSAVNPTNADFLKMKKWMGLHGGEMRGVGDRLWWYLLPESTGSHWRVRLTGSHPDGGPAHVPDHSHPYEWGGEIEPVNTIYGDSGLFDPWCNPDGLHTVPPGTECGEYFSHVTYDLWGRYALYSHVDGLGGLPIGPGVYDLDKHRQVVVTMGRGVQHSAWNAWSDWVAWSSGPAPTHLEGKLYTARYNDPDPFGANSTVRLLCSTHTRFNESGSPDGDYEALARPTQSPDGTKVVWHSTFLNNKVSQSDDRSDLYYVVAYYPHPPKVTGASAVGGRVRLAWAWDRDSAYTARGWPNEDADPPPRPKEIARFHVWVADDGEHWSEVASQGVNFKTFALDVEQPPGTTKYYAVTSEEHSRLESRSLSNVWRVDTDAQGNIVNGGGRGHETQAYPSDPGGVRPFWQQRPPVPTQVVATRMPTPGQYRLTWREPADTIIRYYNIYYATSGIPPADQQHRIASVPVGTSSYLDWLADPGQTAFYRVTSVDRQGNESTEEGLNPPKDLTIKN